MIFIEIIDNSAFYNVHPNYSYEARMYGLNDCYITTVSLGADFCKISFGSY